MNNSEVMTLNNVPIGGRCYLNNIVNIDTDRIKRLYDLGFVNNAEIKVLFKSMSNNAVAYKIRGSVIALRDNDAKKILVSLRR